MKALSVQPHAWVNILSVCECVCVSRVSSRSIACLPIWSRLFWLSADNLWSPRESIQLLHTGSHLGRVCLWLRCEHVRAVTPADAHSKSAYTSIHRDGISTLPKAPASAERNCFHTILVVARDPLFQSCKNVSWFQGRVGTFPTRIGVHKHTHQSFPSSLLLSSPSRPPLLLPIRLRSCLSAPTRLTHLAEDQQCGSSRISAHTYTHMLFIHLTCFQADC